MAKTPHLRGRNAKAGLTSKEPLERETKAMLLRQLYMSYFETRKFKKAYEVVQELLELRVQVDVAHQDAARVCLALGDAGEAIGHLRLAARRGPVSRRSLHLWTLGSTLLLNGKPREAVGALERAVRWAQEGKSLYVAHVALARLSWGEPVEGLAGIYRDLSRAKQRDGYGRFVLGQLAFYMNRWGDARRHLEAFIVRTLAGRPALAYSLDGELKLARSTLRRMKQN